MARMRENAMYQVGGNILFALTQAGLMMVLARLGGPKAVGTFSYALALVNPVMLFFNLGLRNLVSTDSTHTFAPQMYQAVRHGAMAVGGLLCVGLAVVLAPGWLAVAVTLAMVVAKMAEAQSELLYGMLQRAEKNMYIAISLALRGVGGLVALGAVFWATRDIFWATMAYAGAWQLVASVYDVRHTRRHAGVGEVADREGYGWGALRPLVLMGLPLGMTVLIINLNTSLPRLVLGHGGDMAGVGYLASMMYALMLGALVVNAVGQVMAPRMAKLFAQGNRAGYLRMMAQGVGISAGMGLLGVGAAALVGGPVLVLLFGPSYAAMGGLFVAVCGVAPFMFASTFLGYAVTATRRLDGYAPTYGAVAVVNALVCLWVIPRWGLEGAVASLYVASWVRNVGDVGLLLYVLNKGQRNTGTEGQGKAV